MAFKGEVLKGEQPPIVDRDLFEAMQDRLTEQANNHQATRMKSYAPAFAVIASSPENHAT